MKITHAPRLFPLFLAVAVATAPSTIPDAKGDEDYTSPYDSNIHWSYTVSNGEATITWCSVDTWYSGLELEVPVTVEDEHGNQYPVTGVESIGTPVYDDEKLSEIRISLPSSLRRIGDFAFQDFWETQIGFYPADGNWTGWDHHGQLALEYVGKQPLRESFEVLRTSQWPTQWYPDMSETWYLGGIALQYYPPSSLDVSGYKGIAAGAFEGIASLTNVVLPSALRIIPHDALAYCTSLREIIIPDTVTNIECRAFQNCTSLTNITFVGNAPTSVDATAFQDVNANCVVTVQRGTTGWGEVPGTWQGMPIRYAGEEPPPAPVVVDLSTLTGDYTASDGDVLTNSTLYVVTIPAGATVTINGMTVAGGAGSGATGPATFSADGDAITSRIAPGANGTWSLTAFAELASGSADGLDDAQVKVYAANSLAGLASAQPMASGVLVTNKIPAVKVELAVTPPDNSDAQFFRVGFGD